MPPCAAEAGVLYVLSRQPMRLTAMSFMPQGELIEECLKILDIGPATIASAFSTLTAGKRIVIEGDCIYLTEFHIAEAGIAERLRAVNKAQRRFYMADRDTGD